MKRFMFALCMVALTGTATLGAGIGLFGSHWDPDEADDALGAGVSVNFDTVPLELRATFYPDVSVPGAGDSLLIPIDLGLAVNLSRSESFDIYLGAGGSYGIIDADHGDPDNEFGWYALGRLEVPLQRRMNVFGTIMYRGLEFDDIGADLSGLVFNVGLIFR
ncbi:MAG: porin family protein [Candidatus Marinimicrobia bacterium]|nr:porin family protein [Candidatus Neomarinimicrobiota bacterium]